MEEMRGGGGGRSTNETHFMTENLFRCHASIKHRRTDGIECLHGGGILHTGHPLGLVVPVRLDVNVQHFTCRERERERTQTKENLAYLAPKMKQK